MALAALDNSVALVAAATGKSDIDLFVRNTTASFRCSESGSAPRFLGPEAFSSKAQSEYCPLRIDRQSLLEFS
jgi:hypothetical protein